MDPSKLLAVSSMPSPSAPSVPTSMPIPPIVTSMPAPSMPAPPVTSNLVPSMPAPSMTSMPTPTIASSAPNPTISAINLTTPNSATQDSNKAGKRALPDTTTPRATAKRPKSNPTTNSASSPATPKKGSGAIDIKPNVGDPTVTSVKSQSVAASPEAKKVSPEDEDCADVAEIQQLEYQKVSEFGPSMVKRYESYRRSDLRVNKIRKVCAAINPALQKVSEPYTIALKGLAKVFVGDVVETALEVRKQLGDTGPLRPKHLREAYRRLRRDGSMPSNNTREL